MTPVPLHVTPSPVKPYGQRPHLKEPLTVGSQGTPGKQGESAQVIYWDVDPHLTPVVRSGSSSTLVAVWFCGVAVVFLSPGETLLILEMVASGLVLLSAGLLGEVGDDEEEEVGVKSLLEFDLEMWIWPSAPLATVPWPVKHWKLEDMT